LKCYERFDFIQSTSTTGFGIEELLSRDGSDRDLRPGRVPGVDIFKIIEGARERKSTILATIVGDRPALVPEDVGVWVVSNGKLMP